MIIFDENVEQYWIDVINELGIEFISIREKHQGVSNLQVIEIVKSFKGLLITEDKDFGELVFAHSIGDVSIMFLRYDQPNYLQIEEYLISTLNRFLNQEISGFITITKNKIRVRKI